MYMKKIFFFLFFLIAGFRGFGQSCEYSLHLYSQYGFGWVGASITAVLNGDSTKYTLGTFPSGDSITHFLPVATGDSLKLYYKSGTAWSGLSYFVLNSDGDTLLIDDFPSTGLAFEDTVVCPTCSKPNKVTVSKVKAFTAEVAWSNSVGNPANSYFIEYGSPNFKKGTGTVVQTTTTSLRLKNLKQNKPYQFYLRKYCGGTDTSGYQGPYSFHTVFANDVGITEVLSPQTACGLTSDNAIKIKLKNFGASPQSLIPFDYSVNGIPSQVVMPDDGLYAGVLGQDSVVTLTFDTPFDYSLPNDYTIAVWTDLKGDSLLQNDTIYYHFTNIPVVKTFPEIATFETWSNGWHVGTTPDTTASSWELGRPNAERINFTPGGQQAWVTNLDGLYNDYENSYLESPCYDFSSFTQAPRIGFFLNFEFDSSGLDELTLEGSKDGGTTWKRIPLNPFGFNWVNVASDTAWAGETKSWVYAYNTLVGFQGEANCKLRFHLFASGSFFSTKGEGVAIDNISITPALEKDLSVLEISRVNAAVCGSPTDKVKFRFRNLGLVSQSGISVSYQINGGAITTENVTAALGANKQTTFTFAKPFDSTNGDFLIKAWINLAGDANTSNDTMLFRFASIVAPPKLVDFETGNLPTNWTSESFATVAIGHNSPSVVVYENMYSGSSFLSLTSSVMGVFQAGDSMAFEYRYVDYSSNDSTILKSGNTLEVQVSTDCSTTFKTIFTIDSSNHIASTEMRTIKIDLSEYVGKAASFRFLGKWGGGDYYLDLDNIQFFTCPKTFGLLGNVKKASGTTSSDGKITLNVNSAEKLNYQWSNNATTPTIQNLLPGKYCVTVTNSKGCRDTACFNVGYLVATKDIEEVSFLNTAKLFPNPTEGNATLQLDFTTPTPVTIEILTIVGQKIESRSFFDEKNILYPINLENQPNGVYLVRVSFNGHQTLFKYLILQQTNK
jgi:Secretion system C-terminal sorting domain/Fibronectin type III domain